jgi:hypothetical protein
MYEFAPAHGPEGRKVGRGKPTSVNPLGPGGPDGPPPIGVRSSQFY